MQQDAFQEETERTELPWNKSGCHNKKLLLEVWELRAEHHYHVFQDSMIVLEKSSSKTIILSLYVRNTIKKTKIFLMSMYDCLLVSALESVPIYVWKVWVSQPASPNDLRLLGLNLARVDFALHSSMRLIFSWQGTNLEPLPMILWFLVLFPLKTWAEKRMWGQTGC